MDFVIIYLKFSCLHAWQVQSHIQKLKYTESCIGQLFIPLTSQNLLTQTVINLRNNLIGFNMI